MNAQVKWVEGLEFVGRSGTNHKITMDGEVKYGGNDKGMSPMEMLLVAIGGCTGMDVASILQKKRLHLKGIEINVVGTDAETYPKKFTGIELEYIVTGKDIPEEAVKKAIESSMQKYCSVKATLEGSAKINYRYKVVNE
jgi:putative redox protein